MKPCPRCGSVNGFIVNGTYRGRVEIQYNKDGIAEETNLDNTFFEPNSKTAVRCIDCNRIRRDIYLAVDLTIREVPNA